MSAAHDPIPSNTPVPLAVLRPSRGLAVLNLRDVWRFRDLMRAFATRDIKLRYRQTALGASWVVLQPLIGALIFAMFTRVAKIPTNSVAPLAFSFASLLGWTLFQTALTKSGNCVVGNAQLVAKTYFPRLVLPFAVIPGVLLDFVVSLGVMVVILALYRIAPTPALLLLPVFMVGILALAVGVGMFLAALTVTYRDIQYILPVMVQFLFWASPVVLPASLFQGSLRLVMVLNPISGFMEGIRWTLVGTPPPAPMLLAYSFGSAAFVFVGAAFAFVRMERRFADVI